MTALDYFTTQILLSMRPRHKPYGLLWLLPQRPHFRLEHLGLAGWMSTAQSLLSFRFRTLKIKQRLDEPVIPTLECRDTF